MTGFQSERVWLLIFATLVLDGLAGLAGGLLSERWLARHQAGLIGFAAGALLGAVFWDVLPESVEGLGRDALSWTFCGFVALVIVEWFIGHHHHEEPGHVSRSLPPTLLISDALHNIGDGATIAAAFLSSIQAGIAVAIAVIAHEIPQEVGDYALLRAAGWKRTRADRRERMLGFAAGLGVMALVSSTEMRRLL